jgi:hypothetical protein
MFLLGCEITLINPTYQNSIEIRNMRGKDLENG